MQKRIFCFGDSNTYGFDPAPYLGDDQYPAEVRWTGRLNALPRWEILNHGENGRQIPHTEIAFRILYRELLEAAPLDAVVVMLGSNDLFWMPQPTPDKLAQRMSALLDFILAHPTITHSGSKVLLVAPPPVNLTWTEQEQELSRCSQGIAAAYQALAHRLGVGFANAGAWDLPMAFDGVHFSPQGHERFARELDAALLSLLHTP